MRPTMGERERERKSRHPSTKRHIGAITYTYTSKLWLWYPCVQASTADVDERTSERAREFSFLIRWNTRTNSSNSLGNLADHLFAPRTEKKATERGRESDDDYVEEKKEIDWARRCHTNVNVKLATVYVNSGEERKTQRVSEKGKENDECVRSLN